MPFCVVAPLRENHDGNFLLEAVTTGLIASILSQ
jgi:hypothetical protein